MAQRRVLTRALGFSRRVREAWKDDDAGGLAAEVAFFALLSVFPGVLAVAAAVGWLAAGDRPSGSGENDADDSARHAEGGRDRPCLRPEGPAVTREPAVAGGDFSLRAR